MPFPRGLVADVIADWRELDSLADEWWHLHRRVDASPFQSPAWLLPWARHFGAGAACRVVTLRDGGDLAGIAPFYIRHDPDGVRHLVWIGTGNTDHLGPLAAPGIETELAETALQVIAAIAEEWDRCELHRLPPSSPILEATLPAGWSRCRLVEEPCPTLDLTGGAEAVIARAGGGVPANLRYTRRRAERFGPVHFEAADRHSALEYLESLFELHGARWEGRGGGVLADDRVRAFHMDSAPALQAAGMLSLLGMHIGGRLVAVSYGLRSGRSASLYLYGFSPQLAHLGLGHHLIAESVRRAHADGATALDFLSGREPYKYFWGACDRPAAGCTLSRQPD